MSLLCINLVIHVLRNAKSITVCYECDDQCGR